MPALASRHLYAPTCPCTHVHMHHPTHTSAVSEKHNKGYAAAASPHTGRKGVVSSHPKMYANSLLVHGRLPQYPKMLVTALLALNVIPHDLSPAQEHSRKCHCPLPSPRQFSFHNSKFPKPNMSHNSNSPILKITD